MSNRTPGNAARATSSSASGQKADKTRLGSSSSTLGSRGRRASTSKVAAHSCGTCDKLVSEEGIECEICITWFHYSCAKFNKESAKFLTIPGVHWYCLNCDHPNFKTIESRLENLIIASQNNIGLQQVDPSPIHLDGLKALEAKIDSSLIDIKTQLAETIDAKLTTSVSEIKTQLAETTNLLDNLKKSYSLNGGELPLTESQALGPQPGGPTDQIRMYSSVVKPLNLSNTASLSHPTTTKPRNNRVDFDPNKCVVVHSFENKSLAFNHVAIRHSISNILDSPIIMFLKKFEHDRNDPKLMIQFEKSSSVDQLLEKWNPTAETCKLRRPQRPSPRSDGICFGVPETVSEVDLLNHVKQSYPSCEKVIRFMTKTKSATSTVKLIFNEMDELRQAIDNGIYIQKLCLKLRVEKARPPRPRPLQCYQCWGYGHLASNCSSDKVCRRCSGTITSGADHKDCGNSPKCCNCGSLDHDATNHSDCPLFNKILQKLTDREAIRDSQS